MTVSISSAMTASTLQRCRIGKCPHSTPFHQANRKSATLADAPVSAARVGGSAIRSKRLIAASASSTLTARMAGRRLGGDEDLSALAVLILFDCCYRTLSARKVRDWGRNVLEHEVHGCRRSI